MSRRVNISESPEHFMVLSAIARGAANVAKIPKVTQIEKDQVEVILNDLSLQRLVTLQKRRLFGTKQLARATDTGNQLLSSKELELNQKAKKMEAICWKGDRKDFEFFMNDNRAWMPMMLFSGIMSAALYTSMMSTMNMSMSPTESTLISDYNETTNDGLGRSDAGSAQTGSATEFSTEPMDAGGFGEV